MVPLSRPTDLGQREIPVRTSDGPRPRQWCDPSRGYLRKGLSTNTYGSPLPNLGQGSFSLFQFRRSNCRLGTPGSGGETGWCTDEKDPFTLGRESGGGNLSPVRSLPSTPHQHPPCPPTQTQGFTSGCVGFWECGFRVKGLSLWFRVSFLYSTGSGG